MRTIRPPERVVFAFPGAKLGQSGGRYWEFRYGLEIVRCWAEVEVRWWVTIQSVSTICGVRDILRRLVQEFISATW